MSIEILKRGPDELELAAKRTKQDVVAVEGDEEMPPRTSELAAPIMHLSGHAAEVFCCKFGPYGDILASAGFDRQIYLWNVFGDCENLCCLSGHTGAILQLQFTKDGKNVVTCSTDKTMALWDLEAGTRVRRFKAHTGFVNSCCITRSDSPTMICSGGDDGTVRLWDSRRRYCVKTLTNPTKPYQVTAVCFNEKSDNILSGGIDNSVKMWDLKSGKVHTEMQGHIDTITSLSLSPDGNHVLSNSMDNTVRMWDVRPFAPANRCVKAFVGAQHNFEKNLIKCCWSPQGSKVICGSADRMVYVWDTASRKLLYKLPGHTGSVNDVDCHPTQPILMTGSSDKSIFLGELK